MAKILITALMVLSSSAFSQDSLKSVVSVFYFGGSDCPYCVDARNVRHINEMRAQMPKTYPDSTLKFVLVVMDKDIKGGLRYAGKYPNWNEVSIGGFYNNELMLEHVNVTHLPGVPHIIVYHDLLKTGKYNIPTIQKRDLLVDLVGESAIASWIVKGYQLK